MRAWWMAMFAAVAIMPLAAQSVHDRKFETQEPTAALYGSSAFLHGWRDGYQQGFHDADIGQQFAHAAKNAKEEQHFRKVEYRIEYGDKTTYVSGYRAGFQRGFDDMREGHDFRAFDMLKGAVGHEQDHLPRSSAFDAGIAQGFAGNAKPCEQNASDDYCRGARVGVSLAKLQSD